MPGPALNARFEMTKVGRVSFFFFLVFFFPPFPKRSDFWGRETDTPPQKKSTHT